MRSHDVDLFGECYDPVMIFQDVIGLLLVILCIVMSFKW